jgi:hypothetical protein
VSGGAGGATILRFAAPEGSFSLGLTLSVEPGGQARRQRGLGVLVAARPKLLVAARPKTDARTTVPLLSAYELGEGPGAPETVDPTPATLFRPGRKRINGS